MITDAYETVGRPRAGAILFSCEHASNRLPRGVPATRADRALLRTHWGYDPGAAWLTRTLVQDAGGAGVLSRFSRLLCDPNRAPGDGSMFLRHTDDGSPAFNRDLGPAEERARIARFFEPYHAALGRAVASGPRLLFSVHTFTPEFRGNRRAMEAGVLFDRYRPLAEALVGALRGQGLTTEANAPYSGLDGLIYAAARHGEAAGVPYLELEVRQDLVATRPMAVEVATRVWKAMAACGL